MKPVPYSIALGLLLALAFASGRSSAAGLSLEAQTQIQESFAAETQGQTANAIARMVPLLKENGTDYFVNLRLGWLFYLDGKYKNSIDHYTQATRSDPSSVEALLGLSQSLVAAGDWVKTVKTCQEILKRDPQSYLARLRMVQAYLKLKEYGYAIQVVTPGLKAYPTDPVFLEQKGFALFEQGQKEEARKVLTLLLLVSPKNLYARTILGTLK